MSTPLPPRSPFSLQPLRQALLMPLLALALAASSGVMLFLAGPSHAQSREQELQQAAAAGDATAMNNLGNLYEDG